MSQALSNMCKFNRIDVVRVKACSTAAATIGFPRPMQRSVVCARAGAGRELRSEGSFKLDRRLLLLSSVPAGVGAQLLRILPAQAGGFKTFLGYSQVRVTSRLHLQLFVEHGETLRAFMSCADTTSATSCNLKNSMPMSIDSWPG